jgi:arylsulfatase A-like enzyme
MSIFHSVPPTRHGVTTNDWVPMARPLPGLVEQAHAAGLCCASIYNWEPLRNLSRPEKLDFAYFRNGAETNAEADHIIANEAARYLADAKSDFAFVYFGTVDTAGHNYGWMSAEYLEQLEYVDEALGILLDALPANTTVLLQSDHGGHDRNHGTDSPADMTIPWMVSGPNIRLGHEIQTEVSLLDTAPTLARILGIPVPSQWEGRCIEEIFEQPQLF